MVDSTSELSILSKTSQPTQHIEWMWKSNPNPWSESETETWSHYSDIQNLIIEKAFSKKLPEAILDDYTINFTEQIQISHKNSYNRRPMKRVERQSKHLREERFMDAPIVSKRLVGGEYGWISPFIVEVRRYLGLTKEELPSKFPSLIPDLVEKAALGIIEEGKKLGKQCEAEEIAALLREQKNKGIKAVWKRCAYLYSLESFLYKKLNQIMRLIGDKEQEEMWRSKVQTLGPFCLLLWDDPINTRMKTEMTLYRGANLKPEHLKIYKEMAKPPYEYRSFQAFTSCSRNRSKAEEFGNSLFIMKVEFAFVTDISQLSQYKDEEEELLGPGVSFRVEVVELDRKTKKNIITLKLRQRWSSK